MLKRQREGAVMSDPSRLQAGIQMLAEACPEQPAGTWDLLRTALNEGFESIDRRLKELGPLCPDRFSLQEANARLSELAQGRRLWSGYRAGTASFLLQRISICKNNRLQLCFQPAASVAAGRRPRSGWRKHAYNRLFWRSKRAYNSS